MSKSVVTILVTASAEWANRGHFIEIGLAAGLEPDEVRSLADTHMIEMQQRMSSALAWAYSTASTRYPEAQIVLLHSSVGAEKEAARIWQRQGLTAQEVRTDWENDGKNAGYARNTRAIAAQPDVVLGFQFDRSPVVEDCVSKAVAADVPVWLWRDVNHEALRVVRVDHGNVMEVYPSLGRGHRTKYEILMRDGAQPALVPVFEAGADVPEQHHFDGHIDRCNRCAKPKHKGRCRKADLEAVASL